MWLAAGYAMLLWDISIQQQFNALVDGHSCSFITIQEAINVVKRVVIGAKYIIGTWADFFCQYPRTWGECVHVHSLVQDKNSRI